MFNAIPDVQTGRVVFIDDATIFTPRKFMEYVNEGFVPVGRTISSGTVSFAFASFAEAEGTFTITVGNTSYTSSDPDTPYAGA